jgi:hypothetical protein
VEQQRDGCWIGLGVVGENPTIRSGGDKSTLAPEAKVRYETVRKLVDSLGVKLTVTT